MISKQLKKFLILSFVFSLFVFVPKAFATNSNTNSMIHINYNSVDDEYNNEQGIQSRHVSNNTSNNQDTHITTWIGVALLGVIILIALKTLPIEVEKRL